MSTPRTVAPEPWVPRREELVPPSGLRVLDPGSQRSTGRHRRPQPPPPAALLLPAGLRDARLAVCRPAALGIVLALLIAAAAFGGRVAWAEHTAEPTPLPDRRSSQPSTGSDASAHGPSPAGRAGSGTPGSAGSGSGSVTTRPAGAGGLVAPGPPGAGASRVAVHVTGQVHHPGVVLLPAGARVADALRAAGGPLPTADPDVINLARLAVDGEQIRVPGPGDALAAPGLEAPGTPGGIGVGSPPAGPGTSGATGGAARSAALVSLNTADLAALDTLPGVGPVLAQRIVDWRTEHGRFSSVDELGEVSGIGEKMLAQLKAKVTL